MHHVVVLGAVQHVLSRTAVDDVVVAAVASTIVPRSARSRSISRFSVHVLGDVTRISSPGVAATTSNWTSPGTYPGAPQSMAWTVMAAAGRAMRTEPTIAATTRTAKRGRDTGRTLLLTVTLP